VVDAGHQVAVLPDTILADQHWDTFRRRFAGPGQIERCRASGGRK
jgi:transcription-repair coupling factor (superfamily II helicase)